MLKIKLRIFLLPQTFQPWHKSKKIPIFVPSIRQALDKNFQAMKTIKIFLGSSITELHDERVILGDYLMNSVRPIFKQDGIEIEVCKCEDIRSGNTGRPPQNKIDTLLRRCDVSVFMFKTKAGDMTVHEYDVARKLQKRKRHEIYVYCFNVQEADKSQELKDFQDRLIKEPFYWYDCKDITDLESQFILGLLKYERQLLGLTKPSIVDEESKTEKDADTRFKEYMLDEKKQAQRRKIIHKDIEDLLQQTETVMANKDETIAARIFKVIELYKKADQWAEATAYDKEKYSDLLYGYARFLYKYGLYRDAEAVYLRQIPIAEELYGKKHEKIATSYNDIGVLYKTQCDYGSAMEYLFKAMAIFEKSLGTEHPFTATTYSNIGTVYDDQGDYIKALEYHFKALQVYEKVFGTEHPFTATTYNNIGTVYRKQGEYDKALAIREKVIDKEHPDMAQSFNNIGLVYKNKNENSKALEYYLKALPIVEKRLGANHPNTASSYNNIGSVYNDQGDYIKALEYYNKALMIREKVLGMKHSDTATSYNNIGLVYDEQGDYDKALEYYLKALAIREKVLGTEHPDTATSYNHIGMVYKAQGDYGKALESHLKDLAICEKVLGTEHPDTATSYFSLGALYYHLGEYKTALKYLNNAQQIYEKVLGSEHPYTKNVLGWIVSVNKAMKSTP